MSEEGENLGYYKTGIFKKSCRIWNSCGTLYSDWNQAAAPLNLANEYGTVNDLTKCDGLRQLLIFLNVFWLVRKKNQHKYPEPEKPIMDYWPQKVHEGWSHLRELTNRLTPNTTWDICSAFGSYLPWKKGESACTQTLSPHCDNPAMCRPCAPLEWTIKMPGRPGSHRYRYSFGGAKCRDVCPWEIPQRQAGGGLYGRSTPKYAGGGSQRVNTT